MCSTEQWRQVFVSRLVAFAWIDEVIEAANPSPRAFAASGFLLDRQDGACFVTAGHLLHDIAVELPRLRRRIVRSAFVNAWAREPAENDAVHFFDYDTLPRFYEDDDDGLDIGMIGLKQQLRSSLLESGTEPILRVQLHRPSNSVVEQYWITGIPSCLQADDLSCWLTEGQGSIEMEPFCFRVIRLDVTGGFEPTSRERFYASIPSEVHLADLDGVSGAPIFALTRNAHGTFDLWVEAIQAQWRQSARTTAGTLFPLNAEVLERPLRVTAPTT